MMFKPTLILTLMTPLCSVVAQPAKAQQAWSQVGVLNCTLAPSIGLIVVSQQRMSCRFNANPPLPSQNYAGLLTNIGIDIGVTAGSVFAWGVFAQTIGSAFGGLAGTYVGASGEITLAVGGGVNILVGGSNRTVALQPFSGQGTAGLNFELGVAGLELTVAP